MKYYDKKNRKTKMFCRSAEEVALRLQKRIAIIAHSTKAEIEQKENMKST